MKPHFIEGLEKISELHKKAMLKYILKIETGSFDSL